VILLILLILSKKRPINPIDPQEIHPIDLVDPVGIEERRGRRRQSCDFSGESGVRAEAIT
jgi:hypothetical protein